MAAESTSSAADDRTATETFVALRYWAQATQYEPTAGEKALLTVCEQRSNDYWRTGLLVGGGVGFAASATLKAPRIQKLAVTAALGSIGSIYGQYRANRPCLDDLFAHEQREAEGSPLARQARHIMRVGGAATIGELQRQLKAARGGGSIGASPPAPAAPPPADGDLPVDEGSAAPPARAPAWTAAAPDRGPSSSWDAGAGSTHEGLPPSQPARPGDSWEAVRQRYRARRESGGESVLQDVLQGAGSTAGSPPPLSSQPEPGALSGAPVRRARKNAYGDEVIE